MLEGGLFSGRRSDEKKGVLDRPAEN